MTHFDFGVKAQGHTDFECQYGFRYNLIIPNNVIQEPGKGALILCCSSFFNILIAYINLTKL